MWFYKRNRASLHVETRYDNETSEYVAVIARPDGRELTQRFHTRDGVSRGAHGIGATAPARAVDTGRPAACPTRWLAAQTAANVRSLGGLPKAPTEVATDLAIFGLFRMASTRFELHVDGSA